MRMRSWAGLALLCSAVGSAPPGCSCDCCSVVSTDLGLRCARVPPADHQFADQATCGETCAVNLTRSVLLTRAPSSRWQKTGEVDVENFCYHDCAPQSQAANAICAPGVINASMAAEQPTPAPPPRTLLRAATATARRSGDKDDAAASRTEDLAKGAADRLALAEQSASQAGEVAGGAQRAEAFLKKAVTAAEEKATEANSWERVAEQTNGEVQDAARIAAKEVYESTVKNLIAEAHDVAKAKAEAAAAKLEADMKKAAPAAGQAAIKPYVEAQSKAAADAAAWAKQGDAASGLSFQLSLGAGMTMAQANQWNALGDFARGQSMLRQSMETTEMAKGLAGAAQNAYDQSAGIVSHLLDYVPMMGAAQYHAEYMLNPDMPPPAAFGL